MSVSIRQANENIKQTAKLFKKAGYNFNNKKLVGGKNDTIASRKGFEKSRG